MQLDLNNISRIAIPAISAIAVLTLGRSLSVYIYHYLTLPQNSKKLDEARKKGKVASFYDIPGPAGYPFVAVTPLITPYLKIRRTDLFFTGMIDKYGDFCRIMMGDRYMVLTADAAIIKKIANSDSFFRGRNFQSIAGDIAPYALFIIPSGDLWKKHRKGLQPAFGPVHLRDTFKVTLEVADYLLSIWEKELSKGNATRNVMDDFTLLTGDIISKIAFSLDLGAVKSLETHESSGFHEHMEKVTTAIQIRFGFRRFRFLWGWNGVSEAQLAPSMTYLKSILKGAIESKKQKLAQKSGTIEDDRWTKDLLDRLLEPQGSFSFTEEEIMSEMFGFFLAGHETTANTLTWAMLELTKHPEVLEKLQKEVDGLLKGGDPTFEQLSSFKYTEAFVKESLRLHPVVQMLGRETSEEVQLTNMEGFTITIPKGVAVVASLQKIHVSKQYWGENASEFYPDRWLIKKGDTIEEFTPIPGSFLPFWDGPHNCIGQKIAMIEAKVMVIRLVQKFNVKLSPKQGPIEPQLFFVVSASLACIVVAGYPPQFTATATNTGNSTSTETPTTATSVSETTTTDQSTQSQSTATSVSGVSSASVTSSTTDSQTITNTSSPSESLSPGRLLHKRHMEIFRRDPVSVGMPELFPPNVTDINGRAPVIKEKVKLGETVTIFIMYDSHGTNPFWIDLFAYPVGPPQTSQTTGSTPDVQIQSMLQFSNTLLNEDDQKNDDKVGLLLNITGTPDSSVTIGTDGLENGIGDGISKPILWTVAGLEVGKKYRVRARGYHPLLQNDLVGGVSARSFAFEVVE
ncbi:hypothetical protein HK098_002844 [Nowakowskiella sp. JEL0407]|nr:hypothetical protein HK098_002844 [Nowakowskiella sp. JEL0407]